MTTESDRPGEVLRRRWTGDAEDCARLRQFARDYDWSNDWPVIEDPEYAAEEILDTLDHGGQWPAAARGLLRAALVASAEHENARRAERAKEGWR